MASIRKKLTGFEARIYNGGKPVSRTFKTELEAQHWASSVELGKVPAQVGSTREVAIDWTLSKALDLYYEVRVSHQKGAKKALYRLRELQCSDLGAMSLAAIRPFHVRALRDHELLRGCKGATVARKLSILSAFFSFAIEEWELAIEHPCQPVRFPAASPARILRLSLDDESRLLSLARGSGTKGLASAIILAIETGLRRSELLSLTWGRVDFDRRVLVVSDSKNGHGRYVPLTQCALDELVMLHDCGVESVVSPSIKTLGVRNFLLFGSIEQREVLHEEGTIY
jgi:integrase